MQRRLCEMSEAKWSITEAKCLQISHNKYASQRDAISHSMGNLMLSHSAGMHNTDKSIAGISKRFHFASLHYIFSAYLPTHIKSLRDFFQSLLNIHRDNLYIISPKNRIPFLKLPKIQKFSDSIPKTSKFSTLLGFHSQNFCTEIDVDNEK